MKIKLSNMKKTFIILSILMSMVGTKASSQIHFEVANSGVLICYETKNNTEVTVIEPWEFPNKPSWSSQANYSEYTAIVFPERVYYEDPLTENYIGDIYTVTGIGCEVFHDCTNLTSVTIPSTVTEIGFGAFSGCSSLSSVTVKILNPLPITDDVFTNRTNATLYVPHGSKEKYEKADYWKDFKDIIELEPEPVEHIITFADKVARNICVLNWDTNGDLLLSEEEAAGVSDLGSVFNNVSSVIINDYIHTFNYPSSITSFNEFKYFTGISHIPSLAFLQCGSLQSITIPSSVQSIDENAFEDCISLIKIDIPNNVKSIGGGAFRNCI